jgi:hypothetical protein
MSGNTWQRVVHMDRRELADRSRQELSKHLDALLARVGYDFTQGLLQGRNATPGKFFFAPNSVSLLLETLRHRLPQQAEQIVRQADKICQHRFDLLGYEDLDFGTPINWHLDPVHGKQAPRKTFHRIKYLDFNQAGDCKIIWELNRHQHLVTLAKAYRLTQDHRYADELLAQWRHWQQENPYPIGINWASSLEVAFRTLSWVWIYYLLEGTPAMPPDFRNQWLQAQALNGRHIERYLSTYFSPNTHLLGEAVALFFLGTLCPKLSSAERWQTTGWQLIQQETRRQVQPDGFHFEQSTYYHVYALDMFLHATVLASVNQIPVPDELEQTLQRMLDVLLLLGRAGAPPRFGDDDGGRFFDPARNQSEHLLDPLATGAVLFHRGDFKAAASDLREETIWLLGQQGVAEWDSLESTRPKMASASLPDEGLYLLTSNSTTQLLIHAGPQFAQRPGHGHADSLSVSLQSQGHTLLIDPGTFAYVGDERNLFRTTAKHNALRIDGTSQSEPAGLFAWKPSTGATVKQWIPGETFDLFSGSIDHYGGLTPPVAHRRLVFSLKSGLFLVRDAVRGTGKHRLDISWHLGPEMQFRAERLFSVKGTSAGLAILCVEKHGWAEEVRKDVWSPVYGRKEPITVLNFGTLATLPAEFVTLLIPLEEVRGVPGKLTRVTAESTQSAVTAYLYSTESEECLFFFAEGGTPWSEKRISSDAEFVCWQRSREGADELLIFCNGSYVELDGQRVLNYRTAVSRCEMSTRDGHKEVHASDPEALLKM